jgi:hypothetical protein
MGMSPFADAWSVLKDAPSNPFKASPDEQRRRMGALEQRMASRPPAPAPNEDEMSPEEFAAHHRNRMAGITGYSEPPRHLQEADSHAADLGRADSNIDSISVQQRLDQQAAERKRSGIDEGV